MSGYCNVSLGSNAGPNICTQCNILSISINLVLAVAYFSVKPNLHNNSLVLQTITINGVYAPQKYIKSVGVYEFSDFH